MKRQQVDSDKRKGVLMVRGREAGPEEKFIDIIEKTGDLTAWRLLTVPIRHEIAPTPTAPVATPAAAPAPTTSSRFSDISFTGPDGRVVEIEVQQNMKVSDLIDRLLQEFQVDRNKFKGEILVEGNFLKHAGIVQNELPHPERAARIHFVTSKRVREVAPRPTAPVDAGAGRSLSLAQSAPTAPLYRFDLLSQECEKLKEDKDFLAFNLKLQKLFESEKISPVVAFTLGSQLQHKALKNASQVTLGAINWSNTCYKSRVKQDLDQALEACEACHDEGFLGKLYAAVQVALSSNAIEPTQAQEYISAVPRAVLDSAEDGLVRMINKFILDLNKRLGKASPEEKFIDIIEETEDLTAWSLRTVPISREIAPTPAAPVDAGAGRPLSLAQSAPTAPLYHFDLLSQECEKLKEDKDFLAFNCKLQELFKSKEISPLVAFKLGSQLQDKALKNASQVHYEVIDWNNTCYKSRVKQDLDQAVRACRDERSLRMLCTDVQAALLSNAIEPTQAQKYISAFPSAEGDLARRIETITSDLNTRLGEARPASDDAASIRGTTHIDRLISSRASITPRNIR